VIPVTGICSGKIRLLN